MVLIGRKKLTLAEFGRCIAGTCQGKTIHFGSCSTLAAGKREALQFKRATKAKCVSGYTECVEWFTSAAFEILLLEALTFYKRTDAVESYLKEYQGLVKDLGFRMYR